MIEKVTQPYNLMPLANKAPSTIQVYAAVLHPVPNHGLAGTLEDPGSRRTERLHAN